MQAHPRPLSTPPDHTRIINDQMQEVGPRVGDTTSLVAVGPAGSEADPPASESLESGVSRASKGGRAHVAISNFEGPVTAVPRYPSASPFPDVPRSLQTDSNGSHPEEPVARLLKAR
jgi:sirohydrochlorin ferrochelatase